MLALPLLVVVMTATTMALTPTHRLNEQQLFWIQTVRGIDSDNEDGVAFWMEGFGNDDFDGANGLYTEYSYVDDYIYKYYFKLNNNKQLEKTQRIVLMNPIEEDRHGCWNQSGVIFGITHNIVTSIP